MPPPPPPSMQPSMYAGTHPAAGAPPVGCMLPPSTIVPCRREAEAGPALAAPNMCAPQGHVFAEQPMQPGPVALPCNAEPPSAAACAGLQETGAAQATSAVDWAALYEKLRAERSGSLTSTEGVSPVAAADAEQPEQEPGPQVVDFNALARQLEDFHASQRCPNPCPVCGAGQHWLVDTCPNCGSARDVRASALISPEACFVVPQQLEGEPDEMFASVGKRANGLPYARVEPQWRQGNWYIVAPADLKGVESGNPDWEMCFDKVDDAVENLRMRTRDKQGNIYAGAWESLPNPGHWKQGRDCPIS